MKKKRDREKDLPPTKLYFGWGATGLPEGRMQLNFQDDHTFSPVPVDLFKLPSSFPKHAVLKFTTAVPLNLPGKPTTLSAGTLRLSLYLGQSRHDRSK